MRFVLYLSNFVTFLLDNYYQRTHNMNTKRFKGSEIGIYIKLYHILYFQIKLDILSWSKTIISYYTPPPPCLPF